MNRETIVRMLIAMRAQVDAILISLEQEEQAEAQKPVCKACKSENLRPIQTMGSTTAICMACGENQ